MQYTTEGELEGSSADQQSS